MSDNEKRTYSLPLAPQDLVEIYKLKEDKDDFVLWVDYGASREKLSAEHIIIYLANTNFKTTFSVIDEDLLLAYIKSDFLIDSPVLSRFIVIAIKLRYQHELNHLEEELLKNAFAKDKLYDFIDRNVDIIDEVCDTIAQVIPFCLTKFYENLPEEAQKQEIEVAEAVAEIKVVDKPVSCGPNIARLIMDGWDGFLLVCSILGFKQEFNKQTYNDKPSFFGKDLFYLLTQSNITNAVLGVLPPGFIITMDPFKPKTSEEIMEEIEAEKGDDSPSE